MTSSSYSSRSTRPAGRVLWEELLVLQDECFGKNYSSFLDFTCNYERTSGIFVPWLSKSNTFDQNFMKLGHIV